MISFKVANDEIIAFNINFKDFILETVLKGLKILKTFKFFKPSFALTFDIILDVTIKKSN